MQGATVNNAENFPALERHIAELWIAATAVTTESLIPVPLQRHRTR
ncbi:hypothetical protein [Streptomyces sp. C10]